MTQHDATIALYAFRPGRFKVESMWAGLWVVRDTVAGTAITDSDLGRAVMDMMTVVLETEAA